MSELKAAVHYENAGDGRTRCNVSVKKQMGDALLSIVSPSDFFGLGQTFDEAIDDYGKKLDTYIADLSAFRDSLNSPDIHQNSVRMDAKGNLMKGR